MPNVFPSGIFARNVTSYTSKLTVLCGSDEDEQKLNQGNPWLWQDLQTAGLGRNWLLAGTLSAAGINSGENRIFFSGNKKVFQVWASYPPVKVLLLWLACLLQLFPTCCPLPPSAGSPLASQKVFWQTRERETSLFCIAYYDAFPGTEIQSAGFLFPTTSRRVVLTWMGTAAVSFHDLWAVLCIYWNKHKY